MAGEKAQPFVIFTGANTRNGVVKQQIANPERFGYSTEIEYGVQQKGWMDTNGMLDWIAKVWSPIANRHETTILILDSFTAHLTAPVMHALAKCNTEVS